MANNWVKTVLATTALLSLCACNQGTKSPAEKVIDAADNKAEVLEERADALRAEAKSLDKQADTVRAEGKAEANVLVDKAVEDAGREAQQARITDPEPEPLDRSQPADKTR